MYDVYQMPDRDESGDALADTIAPTRSADISSEATVAAVGTVPPPPAAGTEPELPTVDQALYITDQEIARGGMGRIVAAQDRRLGRPVALKELLSVGPEAAARFRREALITARLQHPAIVPVYEAGRWPGGEPFYAMKLVAGKPLDKVVAECTDLESRLALLPSVIAVCEAIAYAHSRHIVHRDLKPSNVLIGDFGETVVIDWGLAKDLESDDGTTSAPPGTETRDRRERAREQAKRPDADLATDVRGGSEGGTLTLAGAVMGTPAYMPPEQARGEPADERADVFSLGAMLYHVLAGTPPYAAKNATDVIAHAISGKVVPLRQRAPRAPADLVAIVEHAMKQEPAERYRTARELAEELRRFQTGQMVGAHRYTTRERIARYVRRHRAAVTIAAIAFVGFAVGGTLAIRRIVQERDRAESARTLAERRRAAAEKLVDFMVSDMRDRLDAVGQLALMSGLGSNVRDYYADLSDLPGGMLPADVERMARALDILGAAERQSGDLDAALATFQDARSRLRELVRREPDAPETPLRQGAIAHATVLIGQIYQARGKIDDALAAYQDAASVYAEARGAAPRDRDLLRGAADAHDRIGDLLRNRGAAEDAIGEYGRARDLRQDAIDLGGGATDPMSADEAMAVRFDLSTSDMKLGSAEQARGATRAALDHYRAAVKRREELVESAPDRLAFQHGLSYVRSVLGDLLRETGALSEARAAYEAALASLELLVRRDPDNTEWRRDRGNVLANIGFVLYDLGDPETALERYRASLDNHEVLTARDPENASWQVDVSRTHTRAGDAHLHRGDVDAALASYRESLRIRAALVARDPKNPPWRRALAWSHHKLGGALPFAGQLDAAIEAAREAQTIRQGLVDAAPHHAGQKNELALAELMLGRLELRKGRPAQAEAHLDRAIELGRELVDADPDNLEWKETLVGALIDRGGEGSREALELATPIAAALPESTVWQVLLADAHWEVAQLGDRALHVRAARAILDELAKSGRLGFEQAELARAVRGTR
jgi:serine/threonine protein kinase